MRIIRIDDPGRLQITRPPCRYFLQVVKRGLVILSVEIRNAFRISSSPDFIGSLNFVQEMTRVPFGTQIRGCESCRKPRLPHGERILDLNEYAHLFRLGHERHA
jgi:hypothetical protein